MKKVWRELNLQQKNVGWLKLAKSHSQFQHGLSPELTVKLGLTPNKEGTGVLVK
jgi:hypothetical protein